MKRALYARENGIDIGRADLTSDRTGWHHGWFVSAEKNMATVAVTTGLINFFLIVCKGTRLDWPAYAGIITIVIGLLTTGLLYRFSGRSERIGVTLICTSLFVFFSLCISTFNYLLTPLWREPIDLSLNAIDQLLGYHWPSIIEWAGQHPVFNEIIRFAYGSITLQLAIIIVVLGIGGRAKELHVLIASIVLTAVFTVCFWGVFPSLGAKSLYDLSYAMESLASPEVDTFYGGQLRLLAQQGPDIISPREIRGLIAFPSYHIVLSCMILYSMRGIKWAFPVFLALNVLIFPGIFMHGGHHMVDLPAGMIVATGGICFARKLVSSQYKKNGLPEFLKK